MTMPILSGTSKLNLTSQGWLAHQSIIGDGLFTSDLTAAGHDLQVSLQGNHEINLTEFGTLNPNLLIGIRQTKQDSDSVTGIEFGLGLRILQSIWFVAYRIWSWFQRSGTTRLCDQFRW